MAIDGLTLHPPTNSKYRFDYITQRPTPRTASIYAPLRAARCVPDDKSFAARDVPHFVFFETGLRNYGAQVELD